MHRNKAVYVDGECYVPDDIYEKINHLKLRVATLVSSGASVEEIWHLLMLLPSEAS